MTPWSRRSGTESQGVDLNAPAPVAIMLVGLQGAGKTTTAAKLAKRLTERQKRRVLMASLDVKRPAAQEQLRVLGEQVGVDTLPIIAGQDPVQIARRAEETARLQGYDVVILDTAGRTHIDEPLMQEMADIRDATKPHEVLLVADALTGQDAVNLAKNFNERVGVTGIVLTRADGDGRGGAALSMRHVTGKPIKLLGMGEKMDALEDFHPRRLADRILGMGDIVSLVEKAAEQIDMEKAAKMAEKMRKGVFDLDDLSDQLGQIEKMGGMGGIMSMLPGVAKMKDQLQQFRLRRQDGQAPARDHLLDDAARAPQPASAQRRRAQGQPQEADRGGRRRAGRGGQPPAQAAPPDGRHDENDGRQGRQGHDGQARPDDGHGRRRDAEPRADRRDAEADRRRSGAPGLPGAPPPGLTLPPNFPGVGGGGLPKLPGLGGGFNPFGKKK